MKPFTLSLVLSGLAVWVCGSYALACGFMVLGIIFALEALTSPRMDTLGEERPEWRGKNTQAPKDPNTQEEQP